MCLGICAHPGVHLYETVRDLRGVQVSVHIVWEGLRERERDSITQCVELGSEVNYIFWLAES